MENDPARPPSPLHMENSICFLQILFESFPKAAEMANLIRFDAFEEVEDLRQQNKQQMGGKRETKP